MASKIRTITAWMPGCMAAATLWMSSLGTLLPDVAAGGPLFSAPFLSFDTGINPRSVAIGDLDGDGKSDLAVANVLSNSVSVLLAHGDGTFGTRTDFPTGAGSIPFSVVLRDVSGDGAPDLVVANR